jgi:hypothetical protein
MIQLLNGELWEEKAILKEMLEDPFYYGHLGKHALSSSAAKKLIESPKAYAKSLRMSSDSQALRDGRLVHLSVLEEHRLKDLVIVDSTKASKAFKGAVEEHGKEMVYTESELNNAKWISKAVKECNEAWHLLDGCSFEKPAIKMLDGLAFRGKADAMKGKTIIDLKTTSGGLAKFKWSAKNFSYDLQAALYLHLFDADEFIFLVVDKDTKDIGIFECSGQFIQNGLDKIDMAIEGYKHFFINTDPMESIRNYVVKEVL